MLLLSGYEPPDTRTVKPWSSALSVLRANPKRVGLFLSVAVAQTIVDLIVLRALWVHAGVLLPVAVACSWTAATLAGYLLNRFVVFRDGTASRSKRTGRYLILACGNAVFAIALETIGVGLGLPYLLVRAGVSATAIIVNYYVMRGWVFEAKDADRTGSTIEEVRNG